MKKKVCVLIIGLVALSALTVGADEYGYFAKDVDGVFKKVSLRTGDRMVILVNAQGNPSDPSLANSVDMVIELPSGLILPIAREKLTGSHETNPLHSNGQEEDRTIVGPCDVYPGNVPPYYRAYISYKIVRAVDNSISPYNVISLPADVNGDMQLVFESSDDLLTWNQEFSFTHNSTNSGGKFFRTRLIQGAGQ